MELPELTNVQRLECKPGDIIVITFDQVFRQGQREALAAQLSAVFVGVGVLILDGGARVSVITPSAT